MTMSRRELGVLHSCYLPMINSWSTLCIALVPRARHLEMYSASLLLETVGSDQTMIALQHAKRLSKERHDEGIGVLLIT